MGEDSSSLISVLIYSNEPIIVDALQALCLQYGDVEVVGQAATVAEMVSRERKLRAQVVLVISPPGTATAIAECYALLRKQRVEVVVLTRTNGGNLLAFLHAGVCGYVLLASSSEYLHDAIVAASKGRRFIDPTFSDQCAGLVLTILKSSPSSVPIQRLSERERDVLREVAEGYSNKEVAAHLFISAKTVETYRQRLRTKLHLHSHTDLVRYAIVQGLLQRFRREPLPPARPVVADENPTVGNRRELGRMTG